VAKTMDKERSLITGIYNYESSTNFQKYLKELGVPYMLRTLAGLATPVVTISKTCEEKVKEIYATFRKTHLISLPIAESSKPESDQTRQMQENGTCKTELGKSE
jgi:hypothetical protein